ncbi:MAG TPA: amino acid adenylation domain-containing protein, partial [Longimicrobiaceae bacterium]|nr:amino acid adenylation domain-containing protein [Longimicrobiaceae bacterium]
LTLQNTPPEPIRLPGVEARPVELHNGTSKFDLTLLLEETGVEGLRGTLEYGSDLFDVATVRRLLEHYRVLLEGAAADAGARVRELPLLGPDERRQVLEAWNRTRTPFPALRVDQLVEAQARRTPQAVAVRGEEGEYLTYRELEEKAGRLAHRLHSLGVGPEVRVALCLERSPDMVVALLGVLRAGGVYVPLDPGHPAERIAYILQDARVSLLLTHTHLLPRLPAFGVPILALDASPATEAPMEVRAAADPGPEALAYVLYTSGSTGRPKGVMVPHRAVVNFLVSLRERPGLAEEDVLLAVTTLSFDIAALEIFLPLTVGARVVVADRETAADGARLAAALRESGATVMQATPATWRMLLHAGWSGDPRLRALCGGEALPPDLAAALRERTREVWNLYGPTETTIWSTLEPVEEAQPGMGGALPIGRPIANTRVYVLDERLEPAPVGVPGELFIGGEGVSRGYWERPELTAERFVPDPFSPDPGARLYRTGDRARWTADGKTEFLGRTDFQVKVRGYRIEPGEIEAVLVVHPGVREALVVVRQDAPGDARLVAYVVPAAEARAPSPCELREHLRGRLPEYMLPSAFVVLDALPLTPNGKVDRRALPDPELEPEGAFVAPRTPTEEVLAGIFAELLRREQIGAHDNFFHLGGHSLLAMQVVARVRHALGAEIPVRTLFERPTLTELALAVEAASGDGWLPAIPLAPRDRAFPLAPAQERLWFLDQMDPGNDLAYTLAGAVRLEGPLQVSALERALGRILERHEVLRTRFEVWEGRPVQVVESAVAFPLPVEDLAGDPAGGDREAAVLEWAAREARHPFDLAAGPLIRARLLRVSPRDHVLLVTVHHLVADGWSLEVLMRDLAELYAASLEGRPPRLPGLPVQYADYAVWHAEWLRGRVEPQLAYWRRELEGSDPVLELPTDRPRPPIQAHRGAVERFVLPAGLRDSLDDLGRRAGATLFMVLLAGLQSVFHRYTGQTDFVIGSPVANRTRPEVEGLIGMFFNTLALRARLEGDPTFTGLLDRVRTTLLGAFQHQDLPFERLVEELAPERRLSHSPIFQVVCAFQDAPGEGIQLPGCEATSLPVHNGTSKFDLAFFLENAAEGIRGVVEYDTDLFDAGTVRRLVGHLCTLLEGAAADPRLPVGSLPLLTREEMERLRAEWSRTEAEYPRGTCLHTLFEAQAAGTPDAVALLFAGREVTYRELDARASRLAGRLRSMGVGPGEVAGVCLDRSPALTVAVLATLKAGGAYVPLDPTYPDARLRYILSDSGTRVLLTDAAGAARLGAEVPCVLCRDAEWEAGGEPAEPCPGGVDAEDVACVIYTSGSTGQPKGVALPHRAVVNRLAWMWREFPFAPGEVLAAKTSIGFVDAVWETFGPLLRGTPTVVLPSESTRDPVELLEHAARWRVTRLTVVPSVLKRFIEEHPRCLPLTTSLRMVVTSGEALERDTAAAWLERFPGVRLVNLYGCTEAGADSTCLEVRDAAGPWALVSIGRSIANTALLVLDRYGNPAPVGIPGELCIAGEGLARGYHGRPDLTAERFVPSPVAALPGRIYRTGDAARYAEDLSVSYLGRIDQQVKVRGIRVEPVEIEEALRRHPAVREAVAAVRPGPAGEPWIVAYLSLRGGVVPGDEELRAAVGEWLPESVIPGAFVVLDELPLTPSGKVDRRALPDVSRGTADPAALRVAPRTPTESRIAEVWRDLLGVESVGVHDSFFALGGHSLLATRLLLRIRSLFGLKLTLKDFFAAPTVAGLAARVEGSRAGEDRILALLESVEQASEEEVERLLALDSPPQGGL